MVLYEVVSFRHVYRIILSGCIQSQSERCGSNVHCGMCINCEIL